MFDCWLQTVRMKLRPLGIRIALQYHDEILLVCKKELQEQVTSILHESMEIVNKALNLNVQIGISVDVGTNYAECH